MIPCFLLLQKRVTREENTVAVVLVVIAITLFYFIYSHYLLLYCPKRTSKRGLPLQRLLRGKNTTIDQTSTYIPSHDHQVPSTALHCQSQVQAKAIHLDPQLCSTPRTTTLDSTLPSSPRPIRSSRPFLSISSQSRLLHHNNCTTTTNAPAPLPSTSRPQSIRASPPSISLAINPSLRLHLPCASGKPTPFPPQDGCRNNQVSAALLPRGLQSPLLAQADTMPALHHKHTC